MYILTILLMLQFAKYYSAAFGSHQFISVPEFFYRQDVSRFQTTVDHLATVYTLPGELPFNIPPPPPRYLLTRSRHVHCSVFTGIKKLETILFGICSDNLAE
jgi:hypothetical protein